MPNLPTRLVQRSSEPLADVEPLTLPIYETTTYVFDSAAQVRAYNEGKTTKYLYSRYENPTIRAVESTLASLEGADAAMLLSSGQAATTTALLALVSAGDEVVCSAAIYGGTLHLLTEVFARLGVLVRFERVDAFATPEKLLTKKTRVVWFESPINPTLRCIDIAAVARACRAHGVTTVIDNTFASPINQQPLALGVDLVMHSATKYLNGHTDVTAGVLIGSSAMIDRVEKVRRRVGTIMDPHPAYLLGRGLKTLDVRVRRQNASAMAVAEWLAKDARVETVYYPGAAAAPRSCDRLETDDGIRRDGLRRPRRRLRAGGGLLRSPAGHPASRQPRRRGKPVQSARADVAVGTYRRGAARGGRDQEHGAAVDRPGGSRGPHRRSRSGAGVAQGLKTLGPQLSWGSETPFCVVPGV